MPKRSRPAHRHTVQSNTYRFFVDANTIQGHAALIDDGALAHQIGSVLRLRAGERVVLLDDSGWQYIVALQSVERGRVSGTIERAEPAGGEPRTTVTLYVALMRPERFEWVLQKGTELGVSAFVPLICARGMRAETDALSAQKLDRWRRIVRESAEQARRGRLPRLAQALAFPAACQQAAQHGAALLLWEGQGVPPLRQVLRDSADQPATHSTAPDDRRSSGRPVSVALFSGPEGGFTPQEVQIATQYGMIAVTLGPRTLRAETAPLVATSAILYEMGDLE